VIDIANQLNAIDRKVEQLPAADGAGERVCVRMRRSYDTPIQDVWEAVTQPDRIGRWLLPISDDLRVGGSFHLEGNAGGQILTCEPPRLLRTTFGDPNSIVELRLTLRVTTTPCWSWSTPSPSSWPRAAPAPCMWDPAGTAP
jgi:Activator of Hsp90 ATPase homolog 1-like protein